MIGKIGLTQATANPRLRHSKGTRLRPFIANCQSVKQPLGSQLVESYTVLQKPAKHNISFTKALEDFTDKAVLAYECGYSESLVREEMGVGLEPSSGAEGRTPQQIEAEECVLAVALIWITLGMLPRETSKRWAQGKAVEASTQECWEGFVRLIVKGYFEKRWAAYPIDRLQAEISLMTGRLERPSIVAEWSRLVYSALQHTAPQWPSM